MNPIVVRQFYEHETTAVAKLCLKIWKESELYNKYKVSKKVLGFISSIPSNDLKCGIVALDNSKPVGVLLGCVSQFWFGPQRVASDNLFWIDREYRNLDVATKIVRAYEKWSLERGAVKINIGTSSGIQTEKQAKLFKHFGYNHAGYMFSKVMI